MNQEEITKNIKDVNQWMRVVYMILCAVALYIVSILLPIVIIVQLLFSLFTGSPNANLRQLGSSLSIYIYQTVSFLTYTSEEKPFPFGAWPKSEVSQDSDTVNTVAESQK